MEIAMPLMNARERVLAAIHHEPLDRVPCDIWATGEVWEKLAAHFGPGADISAVLHIDGIAGPAPRYVGPPLPDVPPDQGVDPWGIRNRRVQYSTGVYYEQCFCPLARARTIDDLERFAWPSPDWFDFSEMAENLKSLRPRQAIKCGYMAPFYFHNLLRGLETSLMDPYTDPEFTRHLLGRLSDTFYAIHLRMFEACEGLIDLSEVTDDYGSQTGPLISMDLFREFYKPHLKRLADLCHGFGIKVFHHDDGAIRPFIPDLIEIGMDVLNPIQANCPGMEMEGLKRDFGGKLCFHGAIDNQQVLPFGTPKQVRAEVRKAIDTLASDHTGFILAPCHNLQAVTPVENIIAMYDETWNYGRFA